MAELSYGAYLVHPLVIGIRYHALFRPDHVDPPRLALYAVYTLLVSFGLAWALHRWIEAPCHDFGRRLAGAGSVSVARRRAR